MRKKVNFIAIKALHHNALKPIITQAETAQRKTNKQMKTIQTTIVEVASGIKTRTGDATLFKGWSEDTATIISLWSDDRKPNPFLKGKKVGDLVRVVEEVREETDLNGHRVAKSFFTVIPSAPQS